MKTLEKYSKIAKMSTLRVGIIGCGGIAKSHVNAYKQNDAVVTAIADLSEDAMDALCKITGEVKCYSGYKEIIDSGEVDAVSVCTPAVAHEEAIVYALTNGIHVLCEKPLSHSKKALENIRIAHESSDSVFMVAFRHRFIPGILKIKEIISSGKIGAPVLFQNVFGGPAFAMKDKWFTKQAIAGGGCMLDTSSHSVDLFRYLIGEVIEQKAVMHQHFEGTDVEDAAILILKADNGTLGTLTSGFVLGDGMAFVDVTGQKGRVVYDYLKPEEVRYKMTGSDWEIIPVLKSGGFDEEIEHFINVIHSEEDLTVTFADGAICQKIIQSNYNFNRRK
jgi:predicted dehydrogenase